MAANTRRIELVTASGANRGEYEDAESMAMTRVRDGGDVQFQATFVRDFRDYEELVDLELCFLAYYNDTLRFTGRVKRLDSDWKAKKVTVTAESFASVLKEIKEEIYIRESDGDYSGLYVDNEIDVGKVVKQLWTSYIRDIGKPVGFRHAVATTENIDEDTGYTIKDFRWDGGTSLYEVMKGLSKAAQYASWGFQDREVGEFYFRKHGLAQSVNPGQKYRAWRYYDAEYTFTTRENLVVSSNLMPHITSMRETLELGRTPTAIEITGGYIGGNRVFKFFKKNPSYTFGRFLLKRIHIPWVTDTTTAENIIDNIFGYYSEPEPEFSFSVWPLSNDITFLKGGNRHLNASKSSHNMWEPAGIELRGQGTIGVSRMTKIVYHWDSVISADIQLGDNEALDLMGDMRRQAAEESQQSMRPAI